MPKTHVKKRIKMQYTRKNDIKGGALLERFRRKKITNETRQHVIEPKKKFGTRLRNLSFRVGKALERFKLSADEKLFGDIPLIPNDFYKPENDGDGDLFILIKKRIKSAFNYEENKGITIPNYKHYTHYKISKPVDVFIFKKGPPSDRIPCVEGIFNISELIINDANYEVKLIVKNDGYSAVFSSLNFTFIVKPESA